MATARLRIIVVAQETDGDVYALATCKFYQPGTATASGSSTSGTPFAGSLYAAISGGSPISTTQTLGSNGTLVVWTDSRQRVDVGIEPAAGGTAFVRQYDPAELDPADVATLTDTQTLTNKTLTSPTINSPTISTPTISTPTFSGQGILPVGSKSAPSLAFSGDTDTGWYRYAADIMDIGGSNANEFVLIGQGNDAANALVTISSNDSSAMGGVVAYQGSAGSPVTPLTAPIRGAAVVAADGGSYSGGDFRSETESGTTGFAFGISASAIASGTFNPSTTTAAGTVAGRFSAESTAGIANDQFLTGLQVNVRGKVASDLIHGAEINLATRNDTNVTPSARVWMVLATESGARSRKGASVDAFFTLARKPLTLGDYTNVQCITDGFIFGDGYGSSETYPFDSTSTLMRADQAGAIKSIFDFTNITPASGGGGFILKVGANLVNIDATGRIGIGTAPSAPLHIDTAASEVLRFSGTTANFFVTTVGGAGGAAALPATPSGYLRISIAGTTVKLPCYP